MSITVAINNADITTIEDYDSVYIYHGNECNEMVESGTMSIDAVPYVTFERGLTDYYSGLQSLHIRYDVKAMYEHFMSEF